MFVLKANANLHIFTTSIHLFFQIKRAFEISEIQKQKKYSILFLSLNFIFTFITF
jgi:hypothetical protein